MEMSEQHDSTAQQTHPPERQHRTGGSRRAAQSSSGTRLGNSRQRRQRVDANAGLLSNFELFDFLSDPARNNYPTYESYQERVAIQRTREAAVSYLSAPEARAYEAEMAEEALMAASSEATAASAAAAGTAATAASAAAASAAPASAASSSSSSSSAAAADLAAAKLLLAHTPSHRDYKPLEGTCWVKSRVLAYLSGTPAATQTGPAVRKFISEAQSMLQANAVAAAKAQAEAAGMPFTPEAARLASQDVRLTTCELIQLVNLRPESLVEIHRAIEECEERLSEEDTLALLQLIQTTLPPPNKGRGSAAKQDEAEEEAATAEGKEEEETAAPAAAGAADQPTPMEQ